MAEWRYNLTTIVMDPGAGDKDDRMAFAAMQVQIAMAERLEAIVAQLEELVAIGKKLLEE